ncbi:sensor histidine kinase [Vampirovibrio sp.]|uniref:sensor histidine kinase n=1 Tax=Vampirovibrio sp. TaxID=2717857 RepID=UPI003593F969
MTAPVPLPEKHVMLPVALFFIIGGSLAYIDNQLKLNTLLLESVHATVVTTIYLFCLYYGKKYPHIRHFGWNSILWGMGLLMLGTWMDILDDPPQLCALGQINIPLGPSWQHAFLKKTFGYTIGIGLFAYGFFQWIPWMVKTRTDINSLNQRLSSTNKNLNQALMSLDEHVESERVNISRELHDDVAQQLTYVNIQLQLLRKDMESGDALRIQNTEGKLSEISANISEALKSVRQISGDLRPESLYSLGLIPALEHFMEKLQHQTSSTTLVFEFLPLPGYINATRIEKWVNDQQLLHLFRVIQEGTRNALKHAKASTIKVTIAEQEITGTGQATPVLQLSIRIEDNGCGLPWPQIPPDETLIQQGHLGIVGLKERVKALSGVFHLSNRSNGPGAILEIQIQS